MVDKAKECLAIEAKGLEKLFKLQWRKGYLVALDPLDFSVRSGEIYGLLGPNGSGKSTTLKLLLGLLKPTRGEAKVLGLPAGSMAARGRMGFLPENPFFPAFLTGKETLLFYGKLAGVSGKRLADAAKEMLALTGLEHAAERPLRSYSKGMLQRIGLAQALLHDPEVLLLDEPTAGVDPIGARVIRELMLQLRDRGKTILFCSHLLEQVQDVADRVLILNRGKKLREGLMSELLNCTGRFVAEFSATDLERAKGYCESLSAAGAAGVSVAPLQRRLEEVFLEAVGGAS
jgi:ABC-2 type transport system ATP-binding protein